MKIHSSTILSILVLFIGCILFGLTAEAEAERTGGITIRVEGIKSDKGSIVLILCNSQDMYQSELDKYGEISDTSFRSVSAEIKSNSFEWIFEDIPYGEYALMLYHDENNNGKLDKNAMEQPKEPYAFSNNARAPARSPPKYEKVKFSVDQPSVTLQIQVEQDKDK